ncbi:MAG TPA: PAC2 family protein, partial [Acidimicrobiales bacterium]|nr:PAC2 family protein [Acidimicrobiales bacterium]
MTTPDEHVLVVDEPSVTDPVLVVAFEGWIDAGFGAATAVQSLLELLDTDLVATFDGEYFLDQRARRPMARI